MSARIAHLSSGHYEAPHYRSRGLPCLPGSRWGSSTPDAPSSRSHRGLFRKGEPPHALRSGPVRGLLRKPAGRQHDSGHPYRHCHIRYLSSRMAISGSHRLRILAPSPEGNGVALPQRRAFCRPHGGRHFGATDANVRCTSRALDAACHNRESNINGVQPFRPLNRLAWLEPARGASTPGGFAICTPFEPSFQADLRQ